MMNTDFYHQKIPLHYWLLSWFRLSMLLDVAPVFISLGHASESCVRENTSTMQFRPIHTQSHLSLETQILIEQHVQIHSCWNLIFERALAFMFASWVLRKLLSEDYSVKGGVSASKSPEANSNLSDCSRSSVSIRMCILVMGKALLALFVTIVQSSKAVMLHPRFFVETPTIGSFETLWKPSVPLQHIPCAPTALLL